MNGPDKQIILLGIFLILVPFLSESDGAITDDVCTYNSSCTGRYSGTVCLKRLTDYSGVIESPNFPNDYPDGIKCTWIIDTNTGAGVNLSFSDFQLESCGKGCPCDDLQIRNGDNENAPLMGTYCWNDRPSPMSSTGNVWLRFRTDGSVTYSGFRLEYIAHHGPDNAHLNPSNKTYTVQEGSSMTPVTCSCGMCEPKCIPQWLHDGNAIGNLSMLELKSVTRNATGQYFCTCTNSTLSKEEMEQFELTVQYGPDDALLNPSNKTYTVQEGSSMSPVTCSCGMCEPRCISQWLHDGNAIGNLSMLELKSVTRNSTGQYFCTCTNPTLSKEELEQFELSVQYGPDSALLNPSNKTYTVQEGSSMSPVTCSCGMCEPRCIPQWIHDGTAVGNLSMLELKSVTRNATGQYFCTCTNPTHSKKEMEKVELTVQYGPDHALLNPSNTTYTVQEGSSMSPVTCSCGMCEPRCISQWIHGGNAVGNLSIFELKSVTRNATGQYICTCTNPTLSKKEMEQFELTVQYGPDNVLLNPSNKTYTVQEGSSMSPVTCSCGMCEPRCSSQWIHDGNAVGNLSMLELKSVTRNASGQYFCTCSNPTFSKMEMEQFELTVQYGPDNVYLNPSDTTNTVPEGSSVPPVTCSCGMCEPICTPQWLHDGNDVGNLSILALKSVTRNATGQYICTCTNPTLSKKEMEQFELTVQYGPDIALLDPSNKTYIIQEGSSMSPVTCKCGMCEPICIPQWIHDGNAVGNLSMLELKSVYRNATGQYVCTCTNPTLSKKEMEPFELTVQYGPDNVYLNPSDTTYTVPEGSSVKPVKCSCGMCEPICTPQWIHDGNAVGNLSILELKGVTRNATGQYICTCTHPTLSKKEMKPFELTVQYGPDHAVLRPANTTYTVQEDSSMSPVTCSCGTCEPICSPQWILDGNVVGNHSVLELKSVTRNATGQYFCTCTNPTLLKKEMEHFELTVHYGPDHAVLNPSNPTYIVQEGSLLSPVTCNCGMCEPSCSPQWTHDGNAVGNHSILELKNVTRNATGQYICTCTNPSLSKTELEQFALTVQYGPDHALLNPYNTTYTIQEGSSVLPVTCSCGMCEPKCIPQWIHDGNAVGNLSMLELKSVTRNATGQYFCTCTNPTLSQKEIEHFKLTVQYGPDHAVLNPSNTTYIVQEGSLMSPVTCNCGMCEPRCSLVWIHDGNDFGNNSFLELKSVTRNDTGQYFCTCTNPSLSKKEMKHFEITVQFGPDRVTLTPDSKTYVVEEGSSLSKVVCSCGPCDPRCTVEWTLNDVSVGINESLEMNEVYRNSTGQYTCICTNPSTLEQESQHFIVIIQHGSDSVTLIPSTKQYSIQEGSSLPEIICICAVCEPRCSARWSFDGEPVDTNDTLALDMVRRNATGRYICTCSNTVISKQESEYFDLTIHYGPDQTIIKPDNISYVLQEHSVLSGIVCSCGGCKPVCSIEWLFNGVAIGTSNTLEIKKVLRNDTGQYMCICTNPSSLQQKEQHFNLQIQYGPDRATLTPNRAIYYKETGSHLAIVTCMCGQCEPKCRVDWAVNDTSLSRSDVLYLGKLSRNDTGQYTCTCTNPSSRKTEMRRFDLIVNALPNVTPCPQDEDDWGTVWNENTRGQTVYLECREKDYTGNRSRVCSKDGVWLVPQYNCIRSAISEVEKQIEELQSSPSSSGVTHVLDELVNLTGTNEDNDELYSGELERVTKVLDIVATLAKDGLAPTEEQSLSFMNTASNLLDVQNKRSWEAMSQTKDDEGASNLLQSVDGMSEAMAKGLENQNTSGITIIQPNIVLEARKVSLSQEKIKFPFSSTDPVVMSVSETKLSLPLRASTDLKSYTVALYKSLDGILPNRMASRNDSENEHNKFLNTPVVSLQVFPYQSKLHKPLELIFQHRQKNFRFAKCSYWSFRGNRWETDGCRAKSSTESTTVCECDHLTNFAVLMSPWNEDHVDSTAIEVISIVGCSISIICLIVTASAHLLLWRNIKNDRAVILINICIALTATYIIFLSGINQTANKDACTAVAALLHYILLVVFCLMLAEGIEITITVKYVFVTKSRIKWTIPLAWGIPAVIVGLAMGITRLEGYGTEDFCWLSVKNGVIWAFVGPAILIITVNVIFLVILLRTMLRTKAYLEMTDINRIKCSMRCLCVLVPLMGCTWVLGIFYVNGKTAWIQYVFALCNSLQGFFIFLFHGFLNKQLRTAIKGRRKRYIDSHSTSKMSHSRPTEATFDKSVVSSNETPESKPICMINYGRKRSWQFKKCGSYSPMEHTET